MAVVGLEEGLLSNTVGTCAYYAGTKQVGEK